MEEVKVLQLVYEPASLKKLCLQRVHGMCNKQNNIVMRDLFVRLPTPVLEMLLDYVHFQFLLNSGLNELDVYQIAEEVFDQRNYKILIKSPSMFQLSFRNIMKMCDIML